MIQCADKCMRHTGEFIVQPPFDPSFIMKNGEVAYIIRKFRTTALFYTALHFCKFVHGIPEHRVSFIYAWTQC